MLLMLISLPLFLVSMNPVSDSRLSEVTGQSGVNIDINADLNVNFNQVGWGDTDGLPSVTRTGGWVGIDDLEIRNLHLWPRSDFALDTGDSIPYGTSRGGWSDIQLANIDLVTLYDATGAAITAQRTGIPTLSITMDSLLVNIVLGPFANGSAGNLSRATYRPAFNQLLGQFYVGGMNIATGTNGAVLIYPHSRDAYTSIRPNGLLNGVMFGSGVTVSLENMKVDYIIMNQLAWGDIEGCYDVSTGDFSHATAGLANQGWIGLADLAIRDVTVNGTVFIEVGNYSATGDDTVSDAGAFEDLIPSMDEHYVAAMPNSSKRSFASISFADNFMIRMEELGAKVQLGPTHDLGYTMGSIYASDMRLTIINNPETHYRSSIRLFAH